MSAEKLILIIVLAGAALAWTTTIDSKTESGYLYCGKSFDCRIKEKPQKAAKPQPKKPVKQKAKVKQND